MAKFTKAQLALLEEVATATKNETGMTYVSEKNQSLPKLLEMKLVEINTAMKDGSGKVACRSTLEGLKEIFPEDAMGETQAVEIAAPVVEETEAPALESAPVEAPVSSPFVVRSDVPIPTVRRGRSGSVYPFEALEIGASFHVPKTSDNPNPSKRLASTVSSNMSKTKDADGNITKRYIVRRVDANDVDGEGARVFRVALK